jgi:hypothetical protein
MRLKNTTALGVTWKDYDMIRRDFLKLGSASILLKATELRAFPEAGVNQDAKDVSSFCGALLWPSTPPAGTRST